MPLYAGAYTELRETTLINPTGELPAPMPLARGHFPVRSLPHRWRDPGGSPRRGVLNCQGPPVPDGAGNGDSSDL